MTYTYTLDGGITVRHELHPKPQLHVTIPTEVIIVRNSLTIEFEGADLVKTLEQQLNKQGAHCVITQSMGHAVIIPVTDQSDAFQRWCDVTSTLAKEGVCQYTDAWKLNRQFTHGSLTGSLDPIFNSRK
jgi:hypothetical protein